MKNNERIKFKVTNRETLKKFLGLGKNSDKETKFYKNFLNNLYKQNINKKIFTIFISFLKTPLIGLCEIYIIVIFLKYFKIAFIIFFSEFWSSAFKPSSIIKIFLFLYKTLANDILCLCPPLNSRH